MRQEKQRPIKTHPMHWELVQELGSIKDPKTKTSIFSRLMDAVAFAACLGFQLNERFPVPEVSKGEAKPDIGWPQVMTERDDDLINLMAIAEMKSLHILEDKSDIDPVKIFEEYAHGGFNKIAAWQKDQPGDLFVSIILGLVNSDIIKQEEDYELPITFENN